LISPKALKQLKQALCAELGDSTLTVSPGDSGSAVVVVESSRDAFVCMKKMADSRQTFKIAGILIRAVVSVPLYTADTSALTNPQDLPNEKDFIRSTRPLPPAVSLTSTLPLEIPGQDEHLIAIQQLQLRQAKWTFNCAVPAGFLGVLVAIWIASPWAGAPSYGTTGVGAGVATIMGIVSFVLLRLHKAMNRALEMAQVEAQLNVLEHKHFLMLMQIEDPKTRNAAIVRLVENRLAASAAEKKR